MMPRYSCARRRRTTWLPHLLCVLLALRLLGCLLTLKLHCAAQTCEAVLRFARDDLKEAKAADTLRAAFATRFPLAPAFAADPAASLAGRFNPGPSLSPEDAAPENTDGAAAAAAADPKKS